MATEQAVFAALRKVQDPEINHDIVQLGMIRSVEVEGETVYVHVVPTSAHCPFAKEIVARIESAVKALGVKKVEVEWGSDD
jgi:ATP-binding protein involved in chromosome partitioning